MNEQDKNPRREIKKHIQKEIEERRGRKMTETEVMQLSTDLEKKLEEAEAIHRYLTVRQMMAKDLSKKSWWCLGIAIASIVAGVFVTHIAFTFLWFLFFIIHLFFETVKARAEGEMNGALEMLVILGFAEDDDCDCDNCKPKNRKKVKKKSWLARPKEFWERMTKSKEAYGT